MGAEFMTAFREFQPDSSPAEFTPRWSSPSTAPVIRRAAFDSEPRLVVAGEGTGASALIMHSWTPPDGDEGREAAEILAEFAITALDSEVTSTGRPTTKDIKARNRDSPLIIV